MKYAVGIDVGGTNTRVALINEKYEIKERVQFGSDPKNPIKTLNQINDVIKGFGEKIEGIGISCPGPLDLINGIILTPPNLPGWHNFELTKELEKITGISVQLENDAFFFQPCKRLAGSDSDDGVLCREAVVDLRENFLIKLRFYCKNDSFCRSDYFIVIQSGDNTKSFFTARSAFFCKVGNNDLVL